MIDIYFDNTQVLLLTAALVSLLFSIAFHLRSKENLTVVFLVITALLVNSFAALLDPFLNIWDERFHALAAKNLMSHPFFPTLYDEPVVNMAYDRWDRYHIWLHKQPLFLWQIAVCFKLFGVSEFPLRLPMVIMGSLFTLAGFRSGRLLVNKNAGYFTALFIITCTYMLELKTGRQALDHNDFTFLVYISLSIWTFIEYHYSGKKRWLYLTALFSGFAVLCKWVVGLLVYLGWFVVKLLEKKFNPVLYKDLLLSFTITVLIALPWQLYTFWRFPVEALQAYRFNVIHFTDALEGHGGNFWYHFEIFDMLYGKYASWFIIPAGFVLYKRMNDKKLFFALLVMVLAVYLFFSMTATKMTSFTTVVSLVIMLALGSLAEYLVSLVKNISRSNAVYNCLFISAVLFFVVYRFDFVGFQKRHSKWMENKTETSMLTHNARIFKSLVLPGNTVIFNVLGRHYIEAMFYTGLPAYSFIPSAEQYEDMKIKKRRIAVFKPREGELPSYMQNDTTVIVLDYQLEGPE